MIETHLKPHESPAFPVERPYTTDTLYLCCRQREKQGVLAETTAMTWTKKNDGIIEGA